MKQLFFQRRQTPEHASLSCILAGRMLILLAAVLLVVMPWTAWFWNFDNFLKGGQDFEFGLLAVLSIFCLLIVLLQRRRAEVIIVLALDRWITCLFANTRFSVSLQLDRMQTFILHRCMAFTAAPRLYAVPLRV